MKHQFNQESFEIVSVFFSEGVKRANSRVAGVQIAERGGQWGAS